LRSLGSCSASLSIFSCHFSSYGCLNNDENNNLVLSSRDFAKAYMTDAWATTFFKKMLEKYSVVFMVILQMIRQFVIY
jgi:hypothetical protein